MKEPVDHIIRPSLPWRSDVGITECGYDASKVKAIAREEFFQRLKDLGQQRCAMITCMTCSNTAQRWGTFWEDPRKALEREIVWEYGGGYRPIEKRGDLLKQELIAIQKLIADHREEFDKIIADNAAYQEQRREWLEKKASRGKPKAPTPKPTGML